MAILIVEHSGTVEGASLGGRILIGRRASNHVVVADPAVSRIHAWIDTANGHFTLTDAGSRTGTFVNGQRVGARVALRHGDRIHVGPARLTFRTDASLPAGVSQLDFGGRAQAADGGILFDCACGAPLWIGSDSAGRLGKCRFCGRVLRIPSRPHVTSTDEFVATADIAGAGTATGAGAPTAPTAAAATVAGVSLAPDPIAGAAGVAAAAAASPAAEVVHASCGACQSPIGTLEPTTACPACGVTFHADCWTENLGCSAYGCSQANILAPKPEGAELPANADADQALAALHATADPTSALIPTEHALLAASVAGLLLGAFTFGIPALLALVAAVVHLKRQRARGVTRPHPAALAAVGLALVGVATGVTVSYFWWIAGGSPDPSFAGADAAAAPRTPAP